MKQTLLAILSVILLGALAAVGQVEDYTYTTNNGTITITGYIGLGGDVVIPDAINALPVSSIGSYVFLPPPGTPAIGIPNISIPNGVTNIASNAFYGCPSLSNMAVGSFNGFYSSSAGVLLNKGQTTLIRCPE